MMRKAGLLTLLAFGLAAAPAATQQSKTTSYGVKGILLMGGEAYVEEFDAFFDIDLSFGIGGLVDTKLGEKFWGGLYVDILNVSAYDETGTMIEGGVALKASFGGEIGKPTWRPGIAFGYGTLSAVGAIESTKYLTIRAGVEAVFGPGWIAEAIMYGAPSGGNDAVTVTYGPMLQLRFGRQF